MKRKVLVYLLLAGMIVTAVACKPKENEQEPQSSAEESKTEESKVPEKEDSDSVPEDSESKNITQTEVKVPEDWTGPEIFHFRLRDSDQIQQEEKMNQAVHQMGSLFLDSRIGTIEQAKEGLEPYGYWIETYRNYNLERAFNTASRDIELDEELHDIQIQKDDRTWIAGYYAEISWWGSLPRKGGPELKAPNGQFWNLSDWWIIHQEDEVFSMMSYTDYRRVQQTQQEYAENPFAAYPVQAETVPESEMKFYDSRYDTFFFKPYVWSDEVFYYEPLKTYLRNETIIFEYEAETEADTEEAVEKAALELGRLYLEELCSKEYDPYMTEKHMGVAEYYVREYKELGLTLLAPSTDGETLEKEQIEIEADEAVWIAGYSYMVKTDDPTWGDGDEFVDYRECGLSRRPRGIIYKQGKKYYMVMNQGIVRKSVIRFEGEGQ